MKNKVLIILTLAFFTFACNHTKTTDKINTVGDATGKVLGEFVEGVSTGISEAFDIKIDLPKNLTDKGISLGKCTVNSDSVGTDNLLSVYIIFNNDFNGTITAKAFDSKDQEMGRAILTLDGKKNEAKYFDFHFDARTNLDSNSKITLE